MARLQIMVELGLVEAKELEKFFDRKQDQGQLVFFKANGNIIAATPLQSVVDP